MRMPILSDIKRSLKCGISFGVFVFSALGDLSLRLFGKRRKGFCVILYYHSIPADQRMQFVHQLEILRRYATPIAVGDRFTLEPGRRYVGVTFDDGFANFVEIGLPELTKYKIPSTVFVIADALGKRFGPQGCSEKVMSAEQIRALPVDLVTIGSHTSSHPFLPSLKEESARREITQSRKQIENILTRKVVLFSFPFGGFNTKLVEFCRDAGYIRVFTTLPLLAFEDTDEYAVGRVRVDPTDWSLEFRLKLAGAYRWLPWAFAFKRKFFANALTRWILRHEYSTKGLTAQQSVIEESSSR
jgi:peptidoglycan/xylan/chitin deacetylase (PgdA/CDA1 family)